VDLVDGIELIPALIGLFAFPEILNVINAYDKSEKQEKVDIKNIKVGFPSLKHIIKFAPIYIRSSLIGTFIGILPGAGGSIASFLSYNETRRASKTPELFGTGIPEGIAAAESSNNAVAGGALIPMLTLGVPGDSVAAIIMGGLMVHGLRPGAEFFTVNANIAYTFILGLFIANIIMLLFGVFGAPYFTLVNGIPRHILSAFIVLFTVIGSFALRGSMFDVYLMVFFGIVGFLMKQFGFDVVPIVLGLILGILAENGLNQTLSITNRTHVLSYILVRPISLVLILLILGAVLLPMIRSRHKGKAQQ